VLMLVSGDTDKLYLLGPPEDVSPEDKDRIHSRKRSFLNKRQDDG
jgi:hypothetical protein